MLRAIAGGYIIEEDFENFCRYNLRAEPKFSVEDAYKVHLEACRRRGKEPMDHEGFARMIDETTKRLEEEED
jgi:hypothetical protein